MIQSPPHGSFTPAGRLLCRRLSQPLPAASAVSAYLGHATLEQTLVYAHLTAVSEAQTQQAVSRMAAALTRPPLPPIAAPAR